MFINIKYGDDETLVLNPDCASVNFLLHLKEALQAKGVYTPDADSDIDLCDWQGVIKGVKKLHPMESLAPYISHKDTYIALMVNSFNNEEDEPEYTPLLFTSNEKAFQTLNAKLKQKTTRLQSTFKSAVNAKQLAKTGARSRQENVTKKPSKSLKN